MTSPSLLNSSKTARHDDMHLWLREDNIMKVIIPCVKFDPTDLDWSDISIDSEGHGDTKRGTRKKLNSWGIKLDGIKREAPVYSHNYKSSYLQGICDAIITYHIVLDYYVEDYRMEKVYNEEDIKNYIDKNIDYNEKFPTSVKMRVTRGDAIAYGHVDYFWKEQELLRSYKHSQDHRESYGVDIRNGYSNGSHTVYRLIIDFKPKLDSISGIMGQLKIYRDCIGPSDLMIITYDKNKKYDPILKEENIHIMRIDEETIS